MRRLPLQPVARRVFRCRCKRPIFFRNSICLGCNTPLGYDPEAGLLLPLDPGKAPDTWVTPVSADESYTRCANLDTPAACNWLLRAKESEDRQQTLCIACRLNRTIPDLSIFENGERWARIEIAKRRMVSSLLALGLPVRSRVSEDLESGLAFDFLGTLPTGPRIITGHSDGLITLNVEEADDPIREKIREQMHEPYRTLLGHLRHEVGHYYWERLAGCPPHLENFRELFGDERQDYSSALNRHYQQGPPPDWQHTYLTKYAASHPWEDWAETWAHYLHMIDGLDTAVSMGVRIDDPTALRFDEFGKEALYDPEEPGASDFLTLLNGWCHLSAIINELNRSLGQADSYPFVLSHTTVKKLHFVHIVVGELASRESEMQEQRSPVTMNAV